MEDDKVIRKFDTGATRDTATGKLDYEAFLSPIVLKAYAEYLNKHRVASDGSLREGDNWQKLFGPDHYAVCMKSLWRHFMDAWLYHRGFEASESIDDALSAIIFNAMAYYYKILKEREETTRELSLLSGDKSNTTATANITLKDLGFSSVSEAITEINPVETHPVHKLDHNCYCFRCQKERLKRE